MNNNGYDGYPTFNNYESSGNNTDIINNNNIVDETISDANSNSELEVVLINQRKYHLQPFLLHLQIRMMMMIDVEDETEIADATAAKEEINKTFQIR